MKKVITAVDLFAGAGGTSTGLALACRELGKKVELTAVNHWKQAVGTHEANHPWAKHLCQEVQFVDPRLVVPDGRLDILVASPSCVFHSRAAGGKPRNRQPRSSPWDILNWLELLDIKSVLIENVPEFRNWCPLNKKGLPIKEKKGETYRAWVEAIRSYGYNVEIRIINSADHGAPTSRSRLFIAAKKGNKKIRWPEPTHSRDGTNKPKWRAAREIIDWSLNGESIFTRKKLLSPNTMRRIITGLKKFGSRELQPFIILMEHGGGLKDIEDPLPTITTAKGGSMTLVNPFLVLNDFAGRNGPDTREIEEPLPTVTSSTSIGLVKPYILSQASGGAPRSIDEPVPTITSDGAHALIEAVVVQYHGGKDSQSRVSSIESPLNTIDTSNRYAIAEPFILPNEGFYQDEKRSHNPPRSLDQPLTTITQRGAGSLVECHILQQNHNSFGSSIERPLPAMTTVNKLGLIESHIIQYNSASGPQSIDEPLPTIPTKDRFGLVQPVINGQVLDIRFRMLQPHELAAAMGFPSNYQFRGNKTEVVKQIGNAVVVQVSRALCLSLLGGI